MSRTRKQVTVTTIGKPPIAAADVLARLILARQKAPPKLRVVRLTEGESERAQG